MRRTLVPLLFLFLSSCVTGHVIKESNRSVADIRNSILYVMGQPRHVSTNGREFISPYFSRKGDPKFDANKSKERLYARISILGDRRPYDIQVEVLVEEKVDGYYEEIGVDEALSDQIAGELKKHLTRSREERNYIDDFNAF